MRTKRLEMKKVGKKKFVIPVVLCFAVILFLCYYYFSHRCFTVMTAALFILTMTTTLIPYM